MAHTLLTPDIIAKQALATLYETLVMRQLVHTDVSKEFTSAAVGDTINIRKPATFEAKTFNRANGIETQEANEGSIPVKLDTIKDVSFAVTAEDLVMEIDNFDKQLLTPAMEALALAVDTDLLSIRDEITQSVGLDVKFPFEKPEVLIQAGALLDTNLVPETGRSAVVGPYTKANWLNSPLIKQNDQAGDTEGLRKANIGNDLFGFDVYRTNNIKLGQNPEAGQPTTEVGLAFHESALAWASAPLPETPGSVSHTETYKGISLRVTMQYDINKKQTVVSADMLYGYKLLDPTRAVLVKGADAE